MPLPLPPRPELPAIAAEEFVPLDDVGEWYGVRKGTVVNIFDRDARRKAYAEELEAVILSTHK